MVSEVLSYIVVFLTYTLHSITGFGGNAIAFPLVSLLLGMEESKVILNGIAWFSAVFMAAESFREVNWKEFRRIILVLLLGVSMGLWLCEIIQSELVLMKLYGFVVILIAMKNLFMKKSYILPMPMLIVVLLLAGVIQGMYLSGGAILVIYAVQKLPKKKEFRATLNMVWIVVYTVMVLLQYMQKLYTPCNVRIIFMGSIPLLVATWIGSRLAKRLHQQTFLRLTYVLLSLLGFVLFIR